MARYHVMWTVHNTHEDDIIIDDDRLAREGFDPSDQDSVWSWLDSGRTTGRDLLIDAVNDSNWVDTDDTEVIDISAVEDDE